jgi:hypothetical protein
MQEQQACKHLRAVRTTANDMRDQNKPAATHRDAAHASNCHVHRDLPKTDASILLLEGLETLLRIPMQVERLAAAKLGLSLMTTGDGAYIPAVKVFELLGVT